MSSNTYISSEPQHQKLYKSGAVNTTLDFSIAPNEYVTLLDVPIIGLDPSKVEVLLFGHYSYPPGSPPYEEEFLSQPNVGLLALVQTSTTFYTLFSGYKLTDDNLAVCVVSPNNATVTPIAPYPTLSISYFIFYY